MIIDKLILNNFRNYEYSEISFCEGINVITGPNAQGKTNLIEAIYYLSTGKSFRSAGDKELISFSSENAYIKADICSGGRSQTLEAALFRGRKRQLFANNVKLKKTGDLCGKLLVVVFCPDDLSLIKEGAAVRRKLMDNAISQIRPGYAAALSEFNKLYEHKTRILRGHFEKPSLLSLLDDFNTRLAEKNAQLIYYRAAFVESLKKRAEIIHNDFTGAAENLNIKYKTVGDMTVGDRKPSQIIVDLLVHQEKYREREIQAGLCLSGAHKDDIEIYINGNNARKFASQGQARTAAVSIKLAERDILKDSCNEYPILLLDDVLSELDEKRRRYVLESIKQGQVFVTCCDDSTLKTGDSGRVIYVKEGKCTDVR